MDIINEALFRQTTPRERQIIGDVAEGLSSKQIARRRNITLRTVENHRANIYRKTGFGNAAEVVAAFIRGGIV